MQGNLVDIQTHDKLSFKTGRYSTTACRKTQAIALSFQALSITRMIQGIKMQKKNCCYGNILPFHEQTDFDLCHNSPAIVMNMLNNY
ncbi:hypothetical protein SARI_00662 [Salmonella enterica subsp. arizonae serovar 62:z4,z23:-]|uniref:Uncharacterized protein n=1 Tax=Salmonella arizonae (strain ATCC BAA-731 / CDC346-86 / RSK2980) TaxID=41514 RepID=A9MK25_SALAR|nr:hypothetical protein SARI_00662 [Salmonella enterica subsp. arizonae serovar 62:z4,z23:-]